MFLNFAGAQAIGLARRLVKYRTSVSSYTSIFASKMHCATRSSTFYCSMTIGLYIEYQVLGSTSIPARLDTLVYWESFSWLTSVGTTRNTVNRLGWSRIGLAVLILNAAGAGLIGRPAVISGRYDKCHSLQLQNHYAHFPPLQHTHIHARHSYAELVMGNDHGFRGIVCWPWQEESCVIG